MILFVHQRKYDHLLYHFISSVFHHYTKLRLKTSHMTVIKIFKYYSLVNLHKIKQEKKNLGHGFDWYKNCRKCTRK